MKQELYDLAEWAIKTAKSAGADDCRASVEAERLVEISYRERKPENLKEASTKSLQIDIYADGRYSSQRTSDLRKESLKTFIGDAVAMTKLLAEDPFRTLPDPKYYQGRAAIDIGLYDPSYQSLTPEARHNFVKAIEETCLAKGGDKVISVSAVGNDSYVEAAVMTSNGFDGYLEATVFYGGDDGQGRGGPEAVGLRLCGRRQQKKPPPARGPRRRGLPADIESARRQEDKN
jgi:PmbA protein